MAVDFNYNHNWFQSWSSSSSSSNFFYPLKSNNTLSKLNQQHFLPLLVHLGFLQTTSNFDLTETTGPFKTHYQWSQIDFAYPTETERELAIYTGEFIPENNLPLGIEVYKDRLFVTMPKWKSGVPATLAVLPKFPQEISPRLVPYPEWNYHTDESCIGLTSVFRVKADSCGRLWVLDSGQIHVTIKPKQICPPAIYIFDLETDKLILKYDLPDNQIKQDGLFSNIAIDIRDGNCLDVHAYLTDVWRFGLVIFNLKTRSSWRITDHLFYPEPLAAAYKLHGLEFQWTDGIFGMALSPFNKNFNDRYLYFHPMSSFHEYRVLTSVICNETNWMDVKNAFQLIGQSRGINGHASASGMDRNGIMFFNMVTRDAIGCWDSRKPYKRTNLGIVAKSSNTLLFPNDLKIDQEKRQSLWVISNKLPFYLYKKLNPNEINFRIMSAYIDEAIDGTICDPKVNFFDTFIPIEDDCI